MDNLRIEQSLSTKSLIWIGFLGGAVIWLIGFLLAWFIAEWGCQTFLGQRTYLGITFTAWLQFIVRGAMLFLALLVLLFIIRRYLSFRGDAESHTEATESRIFLLKSGLVASLIFFLTMLVETIPIFFFLSVC